MKAKTKLRDIETVFNKENLTNPFLLKQDSIQCLEIDSKHVNNASTQDQI